MTSGRFLAGLALVAVLQGAGGCSREGRLHRVEGVVTFEAKPLEGAEIRFFREDGSGTPATAVSGRGGEFRLTTHRDGDGIREGSYKVTVTAPTSGAEQNASPPGDPKGFSKAMEEYAKKPRKKDPTRAAIPPSYGDPARTTLKFVVPPADGSGKINIDLRKSGA
jgi:hypothetical protein